MRLVSFQDPIFPTIQGEGMLVGTPSVFIRTWGCDYDCSWCDTKDSWQEGSTSIEVSVSRIAEMAKAFNYPHYVITGGNPLLQGDEVTALIHTLRPRGVMAHVTVETQASLYHEGVARSANLLSLAPKLHKWPTATLEQYLCDFAIRNDQDLQIKVVVQGVADTRNALSKFVEIMSKHPFVKRPVFILQPESGLGRENIKRTISEVNAWMAFAPSGLSRHVRVIPQLHKTSLYVI